MKLKTVGLFAAAAILVLGAPVLGAKILTWVAEREWGQVQAEAKAMGLPLTIDEALRDYQPGPDDRNAAEGVKEVLREILAPPNAGSTEFQGPFKPEYKREKDTNRLLSALFKPGAKQDWTELREAVKVLDDPLARLEKELKKPDWHFNRDWQKGMALLFPDATHLKNLSRRLHAKALVAMHDGDFPKALQSVEALLRLGRHYQTEPAVILVLAGVTIESIAFQAALDLARLHPLSSSQQAALSDLVRPGPSEVDWRRIWLVEGTGSLAMMSLFLTEDGLREIGFKEGDGPAPFSYRKYLKAKTEVVRILMEAEKDWADEPKSAERAVQVATKHAQTLNDVLSRFSEVYDMLSGGGAGSHPFERSIIARKRQEATRRLTFLALQITAQPTGKWRLPTEASQEAWLDPFSGKPMILAQDAKGFRLYSVGANGVDDGGSVEHDVNDERLDIVVSFPTR